MRTTLNLDDDALAAAMEVAGDKTKTEIVNEALRSFARARRRRQLLDLRGKTPWEGNLDRLRKRS
jgi:Arc/MetJ family transcription regulator